MIIRLLVFLIGAVLFLSSCTKYNNVSNMDLIKVGMDKRQVINLLGAPSSTSADKDAIYLIYNASRSRADTIFGSHEQFYIKIINDRVDNLGELYYDNIKYHDESLSKLREQYVY